MAPVNGAQRRAPTDDNRDILPSPYRTWLSLQLRLDRLPVDVTLHDVHQWLSGEGQISHINLFDPKNGKAEMAARVVFEPPPRRVFWSNGLVTGTMQVQTCDEERGLFDEFEIDVTILDNQSSDSSDSSAPHGTSGYPNRILLHPESIDFGTMSGPSTMRILKSIKPSEGENLKLDINMMARSLIAYFTFDVKEEGETATRSYKFEADMSLIKKVFQCPEGDSTSLIISLPYPPKYFWQKQRDLSALSSDLNYWEHRDLWWRATDIAEDVHAPRSSAVALHQSHNSDYVDIGRWTSFRFKFSHDVARDNFADSGLMEALEDINIAFSPGTVDQCSDTHTDSMWTHLDHQPESTGLNASQMLISSLLPIVSLSFEVRYQLEVCVSQGILSEYSVNAEFLQKLVELGSTVARLRLEYLTDQSQPVYEPLSIFGASSSRTYFPKLRSPHYCAVIRKAVVTPTTIHFNTGILETSNRVIRRFQHVSDRFLRVQFLEEPQNGRIATSMPQSDAIWERVRRTLANGIRIGERTYQFLAFGSSQMRQGGVYFFCPTSHLSCDDIRNWMGNFNHIKVVAKYAARLGQCLSTTREIRGISIPQIEKIRDIERNGYCFTDGVGVISGFLRQMIIEEMVLDVLEEPSAFQFRMGGCKGVLTFWPHVKGMKVQVRASQEKFKAEFNGLEIIRCGKLATATLNRQTIPILQSLGVPNSAFMKLLDKQLRAYEEAMVDSNAAIKLLRKYVDENQTSLIIAELLAAGFKSDTLQEPFVLNIMNLWRSWSLKLLKEKARIQVDNSAFVLGCVDETKTLRGHSFASEGSKHKDINQLPQIFLQVTDTTRLRKTRVIKGVCFVGRNPSLHPGDIRVVHAVDNPKLRHLRDVVVFPSTGDRPLPNMMSGGDLDGDDFFVIWEPSLVPREWNVPPMNYEGVKPTQLNRDVQVDDLQDFFVKYLKNDVLPLIAISHLAYADKFGPRTNLCLGLAQKHSEAVDFPKTGEPVDWDRKDMPDRWPHFMENKKRCYRSRNALELIYDKVSKNVTQFVPQWQLDFDQRVLGRFEHDKDTLDAARELKLQYDTVVRRLLIQHSLETEFELWTSFAMTKPAVGSSYKRQEEIGREYEAIKQRFRDLCGQVAGASTGEELDSFVAAMYKITEEETRAALNEREGPRSGEQTQDGGSMPFISFPWIFYTVMIRLAIGTGYDTTKPKRIARRRSVAMTVSQPFQRGATSAAENGDAGNLEQSEHGSTQLPEGSVVQQGQPLALLGANACLRAGGFGEEGQGIQPPGEQPHVEGQGEVESAMARFQQLWIDVGGDGA